MPITFGAVGDIISVCLLVKDLIEVLDKARGSKAEYQAAIRKLWILDRALLEIDLFNRQYGDGSIPELQGLCETANRAVTRCRALVTTFLGRIRKYQITFDEGQQPNVLKEAAMAVRWRVGEKDALEQFRVEIAGTSSSLQMLLVTASVAIMAINRKEMNSKLNDAERRDDATSTAQNTALDRIKDRIEHANQSIEAGNSILGKLSEALRLDWLRQLGSELKTLMHGAIAVNFATYRAVIRLQTSLPSRLERGLIEAPVLLEDLLGRIAPVHLQFVTSWDAFNTVLELRFENIQGHRKMKKRDYILQDGGNGKEIEQSRPWPRAFLPGQKVEMSFIFHRESRADEGSGSATFPGCQTESENSTDADVRCKKCSMWFRSITVVEEEGVLPQTHLPQHWRRKPGYRPGLVTGRKRAFPTELEDEDDVKDFRRVRLISTKKRIKHSDYSPKWSAYPTAFSPESSLTRAGQVAPPGNILHVTVTLWEDEDSLCFQVGTEGVCVTRREDNHMINGTKLLSIGNIPRDRSNSMLEAERTRHVVRICPAHLKGVWIPFERALELAVDAGIVDKLYPLFVYDIGNLLYHPSNHARAEDPPTGKLEAAADSRA